MKVRTDFVTNSSSSSFIVAYRKFPEIDGDTLSRYPFLRGFNKFIESLITCDSPCYETCEAEIINTLGELQTYFLNEYCCWSKIKTFEELLANDDDDEFTTFYENCKKKLDEGYAIMIRDVGYDDYLNDIYKSLRSDYFIIINDEEE